MPRKFWMVWVEDTPTTEKRHPSRMNAREEANRIAVQPHNLGKKVYVLEAIDYRWTPPVALIHENL